MYNRIRQCAIAKELDAIENEIMLIGERLIRESLFSVLKERRIALGQGVATDRNRYSIDELLEMRDQIDLLLKNKGWRQ